MLVAKKHIWTIVNISYAECSTFFSQTKKFLACSNFVCMRKNRKVANMSARNIMHFQRDKCVNTVCNVFSNVFYVELNY